MASISPDIPDRDSPDPLALPSSPLGGRFLRSPSAKSLAPRSTNFRQSSTIPVPGSSPAKSFVVDAPAEGNASPWRIRVTVEAEPSPGKGGKKVPLRGGSSSPVKRIVANGGNAEPAEAKRPKRKRKGTPVPKKTKEVEMAAEEEAVDEMTALPSNADAEAAMTVGLSASARKRRRQSFQKMPSGRYKRLSQAREELDDALHDAVGYSNDDEEEQGRDIARSSVAPGGDMTVTQNEDFTMVSVETLQSMKAGVNTSQVVDDSRAEVSAIERSEPRRTAASKLRTSQRAERDSGVSESYWPSSPPEAPPEFNEQTQQILSYPDVSAQAAQVKATGELGRVYDEMSWRPTGKATEVPAFAQASNHGSHEHNIVGASAGDVESYRRKDYDMMSWEPTGKAKEGPSRAQPQSDSHDLASDTVPGTETNIGADDDRANGDDPRSDDIWAEEASRSLQEDSLLQETSVSAKRPSQTSLQASNVEEIFGPPSLKPPRAKISRTWRRSSGMDFAYSDSPEHKVTSAKKGGESDGALTEDGKGSGRSDGVLTPPSSGEDAEQHADQIDQRGSEEEDESSFMQPDGAGTQLQNRESGYDGAFDSDSDGVDTPGSASDGSLEATGAETGLFWQQDHAPNYEPQRSVDPKQKARELSELLKENKSDSANSSLLRGKPEPNPFTTDAKSVPKSNPFQTKVAAARAASLSAQESQRKRPNSPYSASYVPLSALRGENAGNSSNPNNQAAASGLLGKSLGSSRVDESFQSKASDERQLLGALASARRPRLTQEDETDYESEQEAEFTEGEGSMYDWTDYSSSVDAKESYQQHEATNEETSYDDSFGRSAEHSVQDHSFEQSMEQTEFYEESYEESYESTNQPSRSYEENLNVESPQKVRVNFNDSTTGNPSLLAPTRAYPPLFGPRPETQNMTSITYTSHYGTQQPMPANPFPSIIPNLLNRLTTTFTTYFLPPPDPEYPSQTRTALRYRYGVLPDTHPFTLGTTRVLHRMYNATLAPKTSSLIPAASAPILPRALTRLIGTSQPRVVVPDDGFRYTLTEADAQIVEAFMQLLVPRPYTEAMERGEVDCIGDAMAIYMREYARGKRTCFIGRGEAPREGAMVDRMWVVMCLGSVKYMKGLWGRGEKRVRAWTRLDKETGTVKRVENLE